MDPILFPSASKKIKFLGMHLAKKLKDLYKENFKSLKKETDTYTSRLADLIL